MVAFCQRWTGFPWLATQAPALLLFSPYKPLKLCLRFSTSAAAADDIAVAGDLTPPILYPINKWEPFCKKKVVMRVGYVGSDYRGRFFLRNV